MNLFKKKLPRFIIIVLGLSLLSFLIFIQQKSKILTDWKIQNNPEINTTNTDTISSQEKVLPAQEQITTSDKSQINSSSSISTLSENIVGKPVRLKIPSINVNSLVEYVGVTPGGAMDSSKGPANVAWFDLGPRPGEKGSAVIDGHSGWRNNIPAVFDDLYKIKEGDKIYVEDDLGATITFVVREVRIYNPNADAYNVFVSSDDKSHLNLITCTGLWNKILKSHSDRLVVFADKE